MAIIGENSFEDQQVVAGYLGFDLLTEELSDRNLEKINHIVNWAKQKVGQRTSSGVLIKSISEAIRSRGTSFSQDKGQNLHGYYASVDGDLTFKQEDSLDYAKLKEKPITEEKFKKLDLIEQEEYLMSHGMADISETTNPHKIGKGRIGERPAAGHQYA